MIVISFYLKMYLYFTPFQKLDTSYKNIYIIGRQKITKEIRLKKKNRDYNSKMKRMYIKPIQYKACKLAAD